MKSLLAPLSRAEESALRKIGFGASDPIEPAHLRRLLQLELIEWTGYAWRLTAVGRRRYETLVNEVAPPFAA
jgi:hypothetical protein